MLSSSEACLSWRNKKRTYLSPEAVVLTDEFLLVLEYKITLTLNQQFFMFG
jgi:hypothetical protein